MRAPISLRPLFALLAVASLAGCMATAPRVAVLEPTTVRPEPTTATAAAAAGGEAEPGVTAAAQFRARADTRY